MRSHGNRIEMRQDRDSSEWNLSQNPHHLTNGERFDVAAFEKYYGNHCHDRNEEKSEGEKTVPEFDPGVELALRLVGNRSVRKVGALWPCGTPEARARDAHCSTRDHQPRLEDQEEPQERGETARKNTF